jgi:putative transposase
MVQRICIFSLLFSVMPRSPRLSLSNVPLHLIQRGNNRQACFYEDEDYRRYLDWLGEYPATTGCRIHAYVLMTNHVHLLVSAPRAEAQGKLRSLKCHPLRSLCALFSRGRLSMLSLRTQSIRAAI